jgi:hypothetical protein
VIIKKIYLQKVGLPVTLVPGRRLLQHKKRSAGFFGTGKRKFDIFED